MLVLSYLLVAASHVYNAQNNNYAISLECLKKVVSDEVVFLHAEKIKIFCKLILPFLWFLRVSPALAKVFRKIHIFVISQERSQECS